MTTRAAEQADFDGLAGEAIFCAWTGTSALSPQRAECLLSVYSNTHCPVLLLTPANLHDWVLPEHPLHEAYPLLSDVHRADYLRCYMMHHYGGGYTDIKRIKTSWRPHFASLRAIPAAFGLGYREVGPHGIPHLPGTAGDPLRAEWYKLIGNCAYIFRKRTAFTATWMSRTHAALDAKLSHLRAAPARHPMDQLGVSLPDGSVSRYPFRWAELLGEIFHPLVYEHFGRFIHADIAPEFTGYR